MQLVACEKCLRKAYAIKEAFLSKLLVVVLFMFETISTYHNRFPMYSVLDQKGRRLHERPANLLV